MATNITYLKGIRTRYRNFLEKEIQSCTTLLQSDITEFDGDTDIATINKCMEKIKGYSDKIENQMEKISCALDETESEFMEKVMSEDSQLCAESMECYVELKQLKEKLLASNKAEKAQVRTDQDRFVEMQNMMLHQIRQQQDFLDQQQKKISEKDIRGEEEKASSVKLPKIDILPFSGDILKWNEFWDSFECTVHTNKRLSNIEKFSYLMSKLSGEAGRAVSGLPLSNENYKVAVTTLKERFGNIQETIDLHYSQLIHLQPAENTIYSLRLILDKVQKHLRSLEVLNQDIDQGVFVSMVKEKLPQEVLFQLEVMKGKDNTWSMTKLIKTLGDYVVVRERSEVKVKQTEPNSKFTNAKHKSQSNTKPNRFDTKSRFNSDNKPKDGRRDIMSVSSAEALVAGVKHTPVTNYFDKCRYCAKTHWSDECLTYRTIKQRKDVLKDSCFKCLREGHSARECRRSKACVHCGERNAHHRSLCPKKFKYSDSVHTRREVSALTEETNEPNKCQENALISSGECVLMQTAKAEIKNPNSSSSAEVRLLLDSGSQRTYITENLADRLNLKKMGEQEIRLATFGTETPKVIKTSSTEISIKLNNGKYMKLSANIVPTISGSVQRKTIKLSTEHLEHLVRSVELADSIPSENESSTIELLIGNDFYLDLIMSEKIEIQPGLYLLGSKLGWILTGRTTENNHDTDESSLLILTYGSDINETGVLTSVDKVIPTKPDLEDFWNVEGIGITDNPNTSDDERAMEQFNDTLKFEDGRYYVTWPWKDENPDLPLNRELAVGRLKSVMSRLKHKPELLKKYDAVLKDQLSKGVIEKIDDIGEGGPKHYLPHHAVINPSKSTTKLRIVYDASAKTQVSNKSLNECLYRGPVLLRDLCGILMRFRLYRTALVADIEKAFLQIGLQPNQRDTTRFVWVRDLESRTANRDNIQEYRFCRVPFGVISSPFLLAATIENHLRSYEGELSDKLKDDIYVDNVVSGTNTVGEAFQFYNGAKAIFQDASMNLREWVSNSDDVNQFIPSGDKSVCEKVKVLGHIWNVEDDTISLKPSNVQTQQPTKRSVLKSIASVFDPQGLFSPVVLRGKVLLQSLWKKCQEWDDCLAREDEELWSDIELDLQNLSECQVPRCVMLPMGGDIKYKLLCFCDASSSAYAASVYLHQTRENQSKVDLMFTKTRLTPVKGMSIPRAELMAVLIGVRCVEFVEKHLKLPIDEIRLWTDSQCVLKWIVSDKDLSVFVRNRISEIKSHSEIKFHYVPTKENPADIATRVCSLQRLRDNTLWWHGPQWLTQRENEWPDEWSNTGLDKQTKSDYESELKGGQPEVESSMSSGDCKGEKATSSRSAPFEMDCKKYSSVRQLFRVTALVLRFIKKLHKIPHKSEHLTSDDLQEAEIMWLRFIQRKSYADTFKAMSAKAKDNLQRQLGLYIDDQGLLRCTGRLEHSDMCEGARRPILLPANEHFTHLLIEQTHKKNLHSGVSQTLSQIRQRYWIPHGRATVRVVLGKCRVCRRNEGGPYKMPPMAPLPKSRVTEAAPFSRTGLDYLGPLFIKTAEGTQKIWVCIFTCLVTRAVHLELVQNMTTEEFLLGIRRFISQRGTPNEIISDNAMQFKSASQTLNSIWKSVTMCDDVQSYVANVGIRWTFIVELAPWMGGFYERLVGLVKRSMRKTLGRKLTTLIQMQTVIKEVEAVLNSRPLVYVGEDINSSITLTPGHFLSLNRNIGIPEMEFDKNDADYNPYESSGKKLLELWKKGQNILNMFWKNWRDDYLLSLRERTQSHLKSGRIQSAITPSIGDVVLLKDDLPRGCWKLARVISLVTSRDGHIRSAKVQLSTGRVLGRPLNLLYPLEITGECNLQDVSVPQSNIVQREERPKRSTTETTIKRIRQSLQS